MENAQLKERLEELQLVGEGMEKGKESLAKEEE